MGKLLKRKMAMCLLAASLLGKSNNSSANEQINTNQLIKSGLAVGAGATVIGIAICISLILMNSKSKVDKKAAEKMVCQENKNKLQNLFNEYAAKCEIKNIQKYWDALNKIAQEDFDDIFKEIYNYHHKKGNKKAKFSNARKIVGKTVDFAVVHGQFEGNSAKTIETIEDCKKHLDFDFEFFKDIFNGEYQVKRLEVLSDNSKIIFKFLTVANSTINVSFESEDYGLGGKSPYENDIFAEREWQFLRININNGSSLDFRFTNVERDFGLEF